MGCVFCGVSAPKFFDLPGQETYDIASLLIPEQVRKYFVSKSDRDRMVKYRQSEYQPLILIYSYQTLMGRRFIIASLSHNKTGNPCRWEHAGPSS